MEGFVGSGGRMPLLRGDECRVIFEIATICWHVTQLEMSNITNWKSIFFVSVFYVFVEGLRG